MVTQPGVGTEEQRNEAMLSIISTIDDSIKIKVAHCKNPYELYQAIESLYVNKTSFQTTALHMRLANFKFKSLDKISEGISELQCLIAKLKNLGENVSDHHVEGIVLAALPSSFKTFVAVWKGSGQEQRTLTNLYSGILAEVEDMKLFNSREDHALISRGKGYKNKGKFKPRQDKIREHNNSSSSSSSSPSSSDDGSSSDSSESDCNDIVCYNCRKPGHIMRYCPNKKQFEKKKKMKAPRKEAKGTHNHAFFAQDDRQGIKDHWIVDSGASFHMTNHREWFEDFVNFNEPETIFLANGTRVSATGSGRILTRVGIMHDVRYVPEIASNLFSVGAVCCKGICATYNSKSVKFYKGKDLVVKGKRLGNLYVLNLKIATRDLGQTNKRKMTEKKIEKRAKTIASSTTEETNDGYTSSRRPVGQDQLELVSVKPQIMQQVEITSSKEVKDPNSARCNEKASGRAIPKNLSSALLMLYMIAALNAQGVSMVKNDERQDQKSEDISESEPEESSEEQKEMSHTLVSSRRKEDLLGLPYKTPTRSKLLRIMKLFRSLIGFGLF